jgi:hypothetical protein
MEVLLKAPSLTRRAGLSFTQYFGTFKGIVSTCRRPITFYKGFLFFLDLFGPRLKRFTLTVLRGA